MIHRLERNEYVFIQGDDGFQISIPEKQQTLLRLEGQFIKGLHTTMNPKASQGSIRLKRRVRKVIPMKTDYQLSDRECGILLEGTLEDEANTPWSLLFDITEQGLKMEAHVNGYEELEFSFYSKEEESFYGYGEQFGNLDMKGKKFQLMVTEQGIGRGAQPVSTLVNLASKGSSGDEFTTYAPMPVFMTSEGRGFVFLENTIYQMDVKKRKKNTYTMQVYGNEVNGYILHGDRPLELIEKHTSITGRLKPLPDFAYGVILGMRGGKEYAEEVLEKCIEHGAPISSLWIEDWQGRRGKNGGPPLWWRWYPDESVYPDFKNWANELKERGIALMGYANPFLSADEGNPLYVEGRDNNYFVKNQDGTDYVSHFFSGKEYTYVCVDLTNEEAFAWLKERMRTGMIENGLSGWMADYAEYVPLTGVTAEENIVKAHCDLPMLWAKLNSELIDETGNRGKVLTFHRSAGVGSNKYATAYWAGDQNPTFDTYDGLASSVMALVTGGISGMAINHTDIGGFTTLITPIYNLVRTKEVMFRWLEYGAFTPVFRTHDGNYANPKNYQFYYDEDGYAFYAKMARIHNNLKFYFKRLEKDMVEKGYPMTRALWLHYPEDVECRKIGYQYLLGEDILVTPVTKEDVTEIKGYIPKGEWILPYDGRVFTGGGYYNIPAKMGQPSVLVRKGSSVEQELIEAITRN